MAFKASANSVFAILAAVFLTLYSILGALIRFGVVGAPIPHAQDYSSPFDLDYLNMKWAWMRSVFGLSIAADGFGMLGLLCLVFTAHQLRKIYRAHEGVAHRALFYCFLFGGLLPVVEFLQNLGVTGMADWMSDPESTWKIVDDYQSMQALDIAYTVTVSRSLWVFSMTNILIAAGLVLQYYLELVHQKQHSLRQHSFLALAIAAVAMIGWVLEIAAFWSPAAVLFSAGVFLWVFTAGLCGWCIWLGIFIFPHFSSQDTSQGTEYI